MTHSQLPHLLLLLSLIDLHESAAADEIFNNIADHGYLAGTLSRDGFDSALEDLLQGGHMARAGGQTVEVKYSAYGVILDLCAAVPGAELTTVGQARVKEIEAYAAEIFVDEDGWAAALAEERKDAEQKMEAEGQQEKEMAHRHGYPYDILAQARETKRGNSHIYVVLLDDGVRGRRRVKIGSDPSAPTVYVGMTGLTPRERFRNHKASYKAGKGYVRDYGIGLLPDLYEAYNPMPRILAIKAEKALAEKLRIAGYTVLGGY
jgi:hypothetical protein